MNTQTSKHMYVPVSLLIAGLAAALFSILIMAIVPLVGWFHSWLQGFDGISAQQPWPETTVAPHSSGTGHNRVKARCDECGEIESIRQFPAENNMPAFYEITVRMSDGSTRMLIDASPANWRSGERTILIGGASSPGR